MAFTFTAISKNKVRFECNGLADAGTVQDAPLNADPITLALLGGSLPIGGAANPATALQVQTHLKVNVVQVTQTTTPAVDLIFGNAATLDNLDGGGLNIPTLHVRKAQTATGSNDGIVRGYIRRIQSRNT